jgi:acyl carrier protein
MTVINQINDVFQEVFDEPTLSVGLDTSPSDIADWDSVAQVKLVLAIEEAFGTRFTTDEVTSLHSVGDFVAALNSRRSVE